MSFHRKAFLIWLVLMLSVAASAMVIDSCGEACGAPEAPYKGSALNQLIEAAQARAKELRTSPNISDHQVAKAVEKEAKRWERLAGAARIDLINLEAQGRKLSSP